MPHSNWAAVSYSKPWWKSEIAEMYFKKTAKEFYGKDRH